MKFLALCLLALTAGGRADGGLGLEGLVYAPGHASADYYSYPAYAFEYAVKDPHTGDNKAQWEKRDGDVVKGAYSLVEPDGSVRVVEYYADDKTGFNAVVKRLGPNLHPTGHGIEPIYKAPIPVLSHGPALPISVGPVAKLEGLAHAPLITGPISAGPIHGAISSAAIYKPSPILKPIVPVEHIPAPIIKEPIWEGHLVKESPVNIGPIIKEGPSLGGWGKEGPILGGWAKEGPILGGYAKEGPILGGYAKEGPILGGYAKEGPILGGYAKEGPILGGYAKEGPILGDYAKEGPILGGYAKEGPILSGPIYKSGPILSGPIYKSGPILGGHLGNEYGYGPLLKSEAILSQPLHKAGPLLELPYGGWEKGVGPLGLNQGALGHDHELLAKGPLLSGWGDPYLGFKH